MEPCLGGVVPIEGIAIAFLTHGHPQSSSVGFLLIKASPRSGALIEHFSFVIIPLTLVSYLKLIFEAIVICISTSSQLMGVSGCMEAWDLCCVSTVVLILSFMEVYS